jgi:hypothetical protein
MMPQAAEREARGGTVPYPKTISTGEVKPDFLSGLY